MDVMLNCPSGCETIHHRLKCGTNVFILPKDRNIKVGAVSVGFGSADREFYFDGKSYVIPPGTAHFLEHEMFNRPDGDISEKVRRAWGGSQRVYRYGKDRILF